MLGHGLISRSRQNHSPRPRAKGDRCRPLLFSANSRVDDVMNLSTQWTRSPPSSRSPETAASRKLDQQVVCGHRSDKYKLLYNLQLNLPARSGPARHGLANRKGSGTAVFRKRWSVDGINAAQYLATCPQQKRVTHHTGQPSERTLRYLWQPDVAGRGSRGRYQPM